MRSFLSTTSITMLVIAWLIAINGSAQSLYPPKVESPNAASLGKFGEVPVNLFTGTPDISIPIHTLSYGRIKVPITLRYNNASVKPVQQPGWVGLGWDLESIGSITRQVRGALDEFYISSSTGTQTSSNVGYYYPYPGQGPNPGPGSEYANLPNWNTQSQLVYDFTAHTGIQGLDVQADEFSFNVMGHSGKFYYSGSSKGWQVVSDEDIKVEMTEFYSPSEIVQAIKRPGLPELDYSLGISVNQPRSFGAFIITVPDGTRFYFGGKGNLNTPDAAEFSNPRTTTNSTSAPVFTTTTWLLKKIVDVYNNEVTFSYNRGYPICNLFLGFYELNASCAQNNVSVPSFVFGGGYAVPMIGSSATYSSDYTDTSIHYGVFQWPMYLSSIQSPIETVSFSTSNAVCSRYTNDQLSYSNVMNKGSVDIDLTVIAQKLQNLQWAQLDKITIKDKMTNSDGINNYLPNTIRQYKFNYSSSVNERLTLNALDLLDKQDNSIGRYIFSYNDEFGWDSKTGSRVPIYADGNYTDHWGYFNNINIAYARATDLYSRKQPSSTAVISGLLNKITYPTGGYTTFTWESNDYSRVVAVSRKSYVPQNATGGGSRIFQVRSFLPDGKQASGKTYYYKQSYSAGAVVGSLASSGVLNGTPQYAFTLNNRTGVLNGSISNVQVTYFNGTTNFSYTGQGAPVGYDEVVEVNMDGSYTKNFFTNYGADLNGVAHWDNDPAGYLGWDPTTDTYFPRASLERERGKLVGSYIYSSSNTLLHKTNYTYRSDPERFNSYLKIIDLNGSYGGANCADALVLATARPVYTYSYYPVTKTETRYDMQGNNPVVQSTAYNLYNASNLLKTKTDINSKGASIVTNYTYPTDYTDATSVAMVNAHILSPVIQTSITNNAAPVSIVKTPYYSPSGTYVAPAIYVPQNLQVQAGSNPIEVREQVTRYDNFGHIQEIQKPNNVKEVYLWGCKSQYIIAKIIGSDYGTASALVDQSKLDQAGVGYNNYSDEDIRTELNKLRNGLPGALVTTYTYKSGIGLATETDPNGNTVYYTYDLFGRPSAILDKDQQVLKKFCYNYAGQQENCTATAYTNDEQKATFTSTASCPQGTTPASYTYIVPAGTFTSYLDKPSANKLAINALNTNGQAAANAQPCLASFSALNTTSAYWNVTVTNTAGTFNKTYSLYTSTTATQFDQLPVGTYNISITEMYPGQVTGPVQLVMNGTTTTGTSFTLNNVSINTATSFTLQPEPATGPCSFQMSTGYSSPTNNISNNGATVSFYLVFYSSNSMQPGVSYLVATINGGCRPSATRTITYTSSGRTWTITINPNGQMYWQLASGATAVSPNTTISTTTLTYNL